MVKGFFAALLGTAGVLVLVFGLSYFGYALYSYFAPRYEQTRNNVFHHSQMYNDGMANDLRDLQRQWLQAKAENNTAVMNSIQAQVRSEFGSYNTSNLSPDMQEFLNEMFTDHVQ